MSKGQPTMIKVNEAIKTIETLGGYKFQGRQNGCYVFDGVTFDRIGQLRFYAEQLAYTYRHAA